MILYNWNTENLQQNVLKTTVKNSRNATKKPLKKPL